MTNFKDLVTISGKPPLNFKEIWVFPNLTGIHPFIFHDPVYTKEIKKQPLRLFFCVVI
jgi:hypothetical protein